MVTTFGSINRLKPDINVTSDYKVTSQYAYVYADATSGQITITLPNSPSRGNEITVKKVNMSGGDVVTDGNGYNIDDESTATLTGLYDFKASTDKTHIHAQEPNVINESVQGFVIWNL